MTITPATGSETFPTTENEALILVETLANQTIKGLKSTNKIVDGLYYGDVVTGTVIEQAIIEKATKQVFDRNKCYCDGNPVDPKLVARYFRNWETDQWETAIREDDIAAVISGAGTATVDSVTADILDSLTAAEGQHAFEKERSLILGTTAMDFASVLGGVPANMTGVLYAMRDMYNQMRYDMSGYNIVDGKSATPAEDIRIALSDKLMALIDITELANIFNLEKVDIMGKLVIIPVGDLEKAQWFKVIVYDRMRFERWTKKFRYQQSEPQPGQFVKAYLTTIRMYFESPLFKAAQLDVTAAATAQLGQIITPATTQAAAK